MRAEQFLKNLSVPERKIDMVLDTDTFNEADDQFAIAYLLGCGEKLSVKAFYAAPFKNINASTTAEGIEKSYNEIIHILELAQHRELIGSVFRGSKEFLTQPNAAESSPAVEDLIERAMKYTSENPLYVVSIGAITNVAAALIRKPEIAENIVVVWLGGNTYSYPDNNEFNLKNDVIAAKTVFDSKAPLVHLPAWGVSTCFTVSVFEIEYLLKGKSPLCDYLAELFFKDHGFLEEAVFTKPLTRYLCDVCAVAWLMNDDNRFMESFVTQRPSVSEENYYTFDPRREMLSSVYRINRDALACDMFERIVRL